MTLVIRTEQACRPPKTMGKRALLLGSSSDGKKGKAEKSSFQTHKEKESWDRLRKSKDPYLVMLFKTSWGDEGDDVRVIQRPRRGALDVQKAPPKPRTPVSLAAAFAYPPQRMKVRGRDDGGEAAARLPSEEELRSAEEQLAGIEVTRGNVLARVDAHASHVSSLRRQGKTREAEKVREAIDVLVAHARAAAKAEKDRAAAAAAPSGGRGAAAAPGGCLANPPDTRAADRRKKWWMNMKAMSRLIPTVGARGGGVGGAGGGGLIAAAAAAVAADADKSGGEAGVPAAAPGGTERFTLAGVVAAVTGGAGGGQAERKADAGPGGDDTQPSAAQLVSYAHLDFYDMAAYGRRRNEEASRRKQRQGGAKAGGGCDDGGGGGGGAEGGGDDCADTDAARKRQRSGARRVKQHCLRCPRHPDNVHPSFKELGHKAPFRFPRRALDEASPEHPASPASSRLALKPPPAPAPGSACNQEEDCSCSDASDDGASEEPPLDTRVKEWRRSWHLTRSRLEHDLDLVMQERMRCKDVVSKNLKYLGHIAATATAEGKAWSRYRIRPSSSAGTAAASATAGGGGGRSATPLLLRPNSAVLAPLAGTLRGRPASGAATAPLTPGGESAADRAGAAAALSPEAERAFAAWEAQRERLGRLVRVLGEGVKDVGTQRDTDEFRGRIRLVVEEGRRLLDPTLPGADVLGCGGAACKRRLDRVALSFKHVRAEYHRLLGIYAATAVQRQKPDLVVTDPARTTWGRSMWCAAKKDMDAESARLDRCVALLKRVERHVGAVLPPPRRAEFCGILDSLLEDGAPLAAALVAGLFERLGAAAFSREMLRAIAFVATEVGVSGETLGGIAKEAQQKLCLGKDDALAFNVSALTASLASAAQKGVGSGEQMAHPFPGVRAD